MLYEPDTLGLAVYRPVYQNKTATHLSQQTKLWSAMTQEDTLSILPSLLGELWYLVEEQGHHIKPLLLWIDSSFESEH